MTKNNRFLTYLLYRCRYVFILLSIFLNIVSLASTKVKTYSKSEIKYMPILKLQIIDNQYRNFFVRYEHISGYKLQPSLKKLKKTSFIKVIDQFLIQEACAAGSVRGEICFFGGRRSSVNNGYCSRPANSTCNDGSFKCDQSLFGGVCVDPNPPAFANLTDSCNEKFKQEKGEETPEDLRNRLGDDNFQRIQNEVKEFCALNYSIYDACDTLKEKLNILETDFPKIEPISTNTAAETAINSLAEFGKIGKAIEHCLDPKVTNTCPQLLIDSFNDTYSGGVVGFVNKTDNIIRGIFGATTNDLSTPASVCNSLADRAKSSDPKSLSKDFSEGLKTKADFSFDEFASSCFEESNNLEEDSKLGKNYMIADFNNKRAKLRDGLLSDIESRNTLDQILGYTSDGPEVCLKKYGIEEVAKRCVIASKCGPSNTAMEEKVELTVSALEKIDELEKQKKNIKSGSKAKAEAAKKKRAEIQKVINETLETVPWVKGKYFSKELDNIKSGSSYNKSKVKNALTKQFEEERNKLSEKMQEKSQAYKCLTGERNDCDYDDVKKTLSNIPNFGQTSGLKTQAAKDNQSYYNCIENIKEARDDANEVLNSVAVSLGTMVIPGGAVVLAARVAKLGANVAKANRAKNALSAVDKQRKASMITSGGSDLAYEGYSTYNFCQDVNEQLNSLNSQITKDANYCENAQLRHSLVSRQAECNMAIVTSLLFAGASTAGGAVVSKYFIKNKPKRVASEKSPSNNLNSNTSTSAATTRGPSSIDKPSTTSKTSPEDLKDGDLVLLQSKDGKLETGKVKVGNKSGEKTFVVDKGDGRGQIVKRDEILEPLTSGKKVTIDDDKIGLKGGTIKEVTPNGNAIVTVKNRLGLNKDVTVSLDSIRKPIKSGQRVSIKSKRNGKVNGTITEVLPNGKQVKVEYTINGKKKVETVALDKLNDPINLNDTVKISTNIGGIGKKNVDAKVVGIDGNKLVLEYKKTPRSKIETKTVKSSSVKFESTGSRQFLNGPVTRRLVDEPIDSSLPRTLNLDEISGSPKKVAYFDEATSEMKIGTTTGKVNTSGDVPTTIIETSPGIYRQIQANRLSTTNSLKTDRVSFSDKSLGKRNGVVKSINEDGSVNVSYRNNKGTELVTTVPARNIQKPFISGQTVSLPSRLNSRVNGIIESVSDTGIAKVSYINSNGKKIIKEVDLKKLGDPIRTGDKVDIARGVTGKVKEVKDNIARIEVPTPSGGVRSYTTPVSKIKASGGVTQNSFASNLNARSTTTSRPVSFEAYANSTLEDGQRALNLKQEFPKLSKSQIDEVLKVHNAPDLSCPVGQCTYKQLDGKIKALRKAGIDEQTIKDILRKGYAGNTPTPNRVASIRKSLSKEADKLVGKEITLSNQYLQLHPSIKDLNGRLTLVKKGNGEYLATFEPEAINGLIMNRRVYQVGPEDIKELESVKGISKELAEARTYRYSSKSNRNEILENDPIKSPILSRTPASNSDEAYKKIKLDGERKHTAVRVIDFDSKGAPRTVLVLAESQDGIISTSKRVLTKEEASTALFSKTAKSLVTDPKNKILVQYDEPLSNFLAVDKSFPGDKKFVEIDVKGSFGFGSQKKLARITEVDAKGNPIKYEVVDSPKGPNRDIKTEVVDASKVKSSSQSSTSKEAFEDLFENVNSPQKNPRQLMGGSIESRFDYYYPNNPSRFVENVNGNPDLIGRVIDIDGNGVPTRMEIFSKSKPYDGIKRVNVNGRGDSFQNIEISPRASRSNGPNNTYIAAKAAEDVQRSKNMALRSNDEDFILPLGPNSNQVVTPKNVTLGGGKVREIRPEAISNSKLTSIERAEKIKSSKKYSSLNDENVEVVLAAHNQVPCEIGRCSNKQLALKIQIMKNGGFKNQELSSMRDNLRAQNIPPETIDKIMDNATSGRITDEKIIKEILRDGYAGNPQTNRAALSDLESLFVSQVDNIDDFGTFNATRATLPTSSPHKDWFSNLYPSSRAGDVNNTPAKITISSNGKTQEIEALITGTNKDGTRLALFDYESGQTRYLDLTKDDFEVTSIVGFRRSLDDSNPGLRTQLDDFQEYSIFETGASNAVRRDTNIRPNSNIEYNVDYKRVDPEDGEVFEGTIKGQLVEKDGKLMLRQKKAVNGSDSFYDLDEIGTTQVTSNYPSQNWTPSSNTNLEKEFIKGSNVKVTGSAIDGYKGKKQVTIEGEYVGVIENQTGGRGSPVAKQIVIRLEDNSLRYLPISDINAVETAGGTINHFRSPAGR